MANHLTISKLQCPNLTTHASFIPAYRETTEVSAKRHDERISRNQFTNVSSLTCAYKLEKGRKMASEQHR